jgi:hypothetical protein
MIKVTMALVATALGLALLLSFKSHSASTPRSALAGLSPGSPSASDGTNGTRTSSPSPTSAKRRPKASTRPAGKINAGAIPVLRSEALSARSANIDVVSGATFISEGYAKSLQSALDKAGI